MLVPALADYADWGLLALAGMAQAVGISPAAGWVWMLAQGAVEVGGGALLIGGILTQLVALAFMVIMIGAISFKIVLWKTGFMAQETTGWEFDFALLAANLLLLLAGPGSIAIMPSAGLG